MKDGWDEQYIEKITALDFSCSMVLSMKKVFFGTGVNMWVEDGIIRHLLTCQKCRDIYTQYAKEVGYKNFNLIKYAIKFAEQNKQYNLKTIEYLNETKENKKFRVHSRLWTRAASDFNLNKLMNMKAFRDLSMEYNSPTGLDYSDFMKYVIFKIAKRVDHLEECLLKTEENILHEKSK